MNRVLKALVPTVLLAQLALITSATAVWAILSEMHAGKYMIMGAEAIDVVASAVLAVIIFRRAFEAEERMTQIPVQND
ncbi:MAG: hypothetical protein RH945_01060 [Hyphomonas sp.]|tara:strand:- start:1886 stop:2119 length:234 start_codon:yes stop_codon:yes gene_type:complete